MKTRLVDELKNASEFIEWGRENEKESERERKKWSCVSIELQ